jgi:hypothetical protein
MAFLGSAVGLIGSLFSHGSSYANPLVANNPYLAQENAAQNELMATNAQETIMSAKSSEQDLSISSQSSRAVNRASVLSQVTSKHEGLMQSIQQSENTHIKQAFDIVKQA